MRIRPAIALTSASFIGLLFAPLVAGAVRPNVVIILADDLGYSDLGCYGGEIDTPNLDRLASQGVRFTQFYNQARCCPSRAALLTGRYPHQVGVGAMIDDYARCIRDAASRLSYQDGLSPQSPTFAELLKAGGYRTMMCGKWHLGERPGEWPVRRGFERSFVLLPGAMNYWVGGSDGPRAKMALNDQPWEPPADGVFATDAFTHYAIEFLNGAKADGRPFILYLAYNAPHWPLHAPPEDIERYRNTYDAGWQATRQRRRRRMVELGRTRDVVQADAPRLRWIGRVSGRVGDCEPAVRGDRHVYRGIVPARIRVDAELAPDLGCRRSRTAVRKHPRGRGRPG